MTAEQLACFDAIVSGNFRVLDRVYFDPRTKTLNFRCYFTVTGSATEQQLRLAIMPDGRIMDRNTEQFAALLTRLQ